MLSLRTGVWRRGSPCRRSPWLSPPEHLSAEQQHLTPATRKGPSDLGHLLAQAQLVQTPRAEHRRACVDPHLAPCRGEGSYRPGRREKAVSWIVKRENPGRPFGTWWARSLCAHEQSR